MNTVAKIQETQNYIQACLGQLRSSLDIEAIWPEAFEHGKVRFSGIQKINHTDVKRELCFTQAWFENSDERYYLSRQELKQFKPDALIHPEYFDFSIIDSAIGE